jgi:hypothetical protein
MAPDDCNRTWRWQPLRVRVKAGLRQIIAAYLAACLVLAGMVGLSPSLHVLLEHGGDGPAHVHGRKAQVRPSSLVAQPREQSSARVSHPHADVSSRAGSTTLFVHSSTTFPAVDELVARFWHRLHHWLEHESSAPVPRNAAPEHRHDSLASLLAEGGVEPANTLIHCVEAGCSFSRCLLTAPERLRGFDRDLQSSPRAPPASQG